MYLLAYLISVCFLRQTRSFLSTGGHVSFFTTLLSAWQIVDDQLVMLNE